MSKKKLVSDKKTLVFKTSAEKIHGSSFKEISKAAELIFKRIKSRTKRTPYIRSKYFRSEKIFLSIFWHHLHQKHEKDRVRRLQFYACAIDLLKNSTLDPETRENFKQKNELLHRFLGQTKSRENFVVQIKENKRTKRKDFISIFPLK